MAQYLILIYGNEAAYASSTAEDTALLHKAHNRFQEQVVEQGGTIKGGEALEDSSTATSIRDDVITDGPFAETKEALGGFYLIEARDLDHAIALAKLCPAPFGGVEVRPIVDFSQA
jgi:hypothetical protein